MFKNFIKSCLPACKKIEQAILISTISTITSIVISDKFSKWYAKRKLKKEAIKELKEAKE